jgi:hypothetical protein
MSGDKPRGGRKPRSADEAQAEPVAPGHARDLITDLFGLSGVLVVGSGIALLMWIPSFTHTAADPSLRTNTVVLAGLCFTGWGVRKAAMFEGLKDFMKK